MNIDIVFKIAAVGILVAVLNQVLIRAGREEQAMMTTLAGLVVVLTGQDAVISHAMGVLALVLALLFDSMLSRACGEKNDLEA